MTTSSARPLALVTGASSGIGADLARWRETAMIWCSLHAAGTDGGCRELQAYGAGSVVVAADLSSPAPLIGKAIETRGLMVEVWSTMPGSAHRPLRLTDPQDHEITRSTSWY
jgi:NAD(P)-dependent dehydrogenase (short-subunit alcohol dehydrogenase family)